MIRKIRRIQLLLAMALLLTGMLHSVAAAQGLICAGSHAPEGASPTMLVSGDGSDLSSPDSPHTHRANGEVAPPIPHSDPAVLSPGTCGTANPAIERDVLPRHLVVRLTPPSGDLLPANPPNPPCFRPPRPS